MDSTKLAPHEAIEIRELISQGMIGIKEISSSMNIVKDAELKTFMQDSVNSKKSALKNIQSALGTM